MRDDFAVFIISHERVDCPTYYKLKKYGYTGKFYVVVDDKDSQLKEYKETFKDELYIFNKDDYLEECDTLDNFNGPNCIALFARNVCLKYAKELNLNYILMIDDDLCSLAYRCVYDNHFKYQIAKNIDIIFEHILNMMDKISLFNLFSFQMSPKIHGAKDPVRTDAYQAFMIKVKNAINFKGREGEDVIFHREIATKSFSMSIPIINSTFKYNAFNDHVQQSGGMNDYYKSRLSRYYITMPKLMFIPNDINSLKIRLYPKNPNEIFFDVVGFSPSNSIKLLSEIYKK